MTKIVKCTLSLVVILPIAVVIIFILGFLFSNPEIKFEIPQKVGGVLVVDGIEWMDIQSFGDIVKLKYKPNDHEEYYIGESDYYGRNFEKTKQIILMGKYYLLSAGNRLEGDKLYGSVDLRVWKELVFDRKLILKVDKETQLYLNNYYPDLVFIKDIKRGIAEWERRIDVKDTNPRKLSFNYEIDWDNGKLIYSKGIKN